MAESDELLPLDSALGWFHQIASAVAHCHAYGAVHGQLHPENVLLSGEGMCQLIGFSRCKARTGATGRATGGSTGGATGGADVSSAGGGAGGNLIMEDAAASSGSGGGGASGGAAHPPPLAECSVRLRPPHPDLDAPELHGRSALSGPTDVVTSELMCCDVWALGMILVYLLTGRPNTQSFAQRMASRGGRVTRGHSVGEHAGGDSRAESHTGGHTGGQHAGGHASSQSENRDRLDPGSPLGDELLGDLHNSVGSIDLADPTHPSTLAALDQAGAAAPASSSSSRYPRHRDDAFISPTGEEEIPQEIIELASSLLSREPSERPSAAELLSRLQDITPMQPERRSSF